MAQGLAHELVKGQTVEQGSSPGNKHKSIYKVTIYYIVLCICSTFLGSGEVALLPARSQLLTSCQNLSYIHFMDNRGSIHLKYSGSNINMNLKCLQINCVWGFL